MEQVYALLVASQEGPLVNTAFSCRMQFALLRHFAKHTVEKVWPDAWAVMKGRPETSLMRKWQVMNAAMCSRELFLTKFRNEVQMYLERASLDHILEAISLEQEPQPEVWQEIVGQRIGFFPFCG